MDEIDGISRSISYTYDAAGNRTSVTTASGTTFYEFDERNRLDIIRQDGTIVTVYAYNAANNLVSTKLGNGTEEIRQYDDLNCLKYLENRSATEVLSRFTYVLDKVGNRREITEHNGRKIKYSYDDLYRLTKEEIEEVELGVSDRTIEYYYDKVGNRLRKKEALNGTTTQTDYQYDKNDRLLWEKENGTQTVSYTYDSNGSTKTKVENGVTTSYTWNDEKRLVGVDVTQSGQPSKQLQYRYNDDGIRVSSSVDGVETHYLLDEVQAYPQVLEEYAPDGSVQVSYVYGNDLIHQTQGGQTTYYHVDGLGSTTELTDATGNVVSRSRYDAFGNGVRKEGVISNKYLFAGEQFDSSLDNYYIRARYYDTSIGRFTRKDCYEGRLNEPLTLHKYIYTHNNSVNYIDPTGKFTLTEVMASSAVVGALVGSSAGAYYGTQQSGKFVSLETFKYALVGAVGGATAGAMLGAALYVSPAGLSPTIQTGLRQLWIKANAPHTTTSIAMISGFGVGLTAGLLEPDYPEVLNPVIKLHTLGNKCGRQEIEAPVDNRTTTTQF